MKKIVFYFALLFAVPVNAQSIGSHVNDIIQLNPGGKLEYGSSPSYSVLTESSLLIYFLNESLICISMAVYPSSDNSRQIWVESLNDKWVIIDATHWRYYRSDNVVLGAEMKYVKGVGPVIFVSLLSMDGE